MRERVPALALANLFDGTYYLTQSGTPEKPIVIKGAGDGEVIFDGAGCQTFFNLMGANCNYFEGITFRNANRSQARQRWMQEPKYQA